MNKDKYTHELTMVKSHDNILMPIISNLINNTIRLESGEEIPEIQLMSGEAIKDLVIGTLICYVEDVRWNGKHASEQKYPKPLIDKAKYVQYVYDNAMRPDMTKEKHELHQMAKDDLIAYCYNIYLNSEGIKIGR